jgi:hypothetical protein
MIELQDKHNGLPGLLSSLQTEEETGIIGDDRDLKRRKEYFGANTKPHSKVPKLRDAIVDATKSPIMLIVASCAILSIVTGMIQEKGKLAGCVKGVSVLIALLI